MNIIRTVLVYNAVFYIWMTVADLNFVNIAGRNRSTIDNNRRLTADRLVEKTRCRVGSGRVRTVSIYAVDSCRQTSQPLVHMQD